MRGMECGALTQQGVSCSSFFFLADDLNALAGTVAVPGRRWLLCRKLSNQPQRYLINQQNGVDLRSCCRRNSRRLLVSRNAYRSAPACSRPQNHHMGGCQNYGPLLGFRNTRCHIVLRTRKGVIILTSTHIARVR